MSPNPNPVRPKVKAAARGGTAATGSAAIVAWALGVAGVNVDSIPAEVLVLISGVYATTVAAACAYVKRDGLRGAWRRLVNGERT